MNTSKLTTALALTLVAGCGSSKSSSDSGAGGGSTQNTPGQTTGGASEEGVLLVGDPVAASQVITAQIDSGITAAATENDASASVSLALAPVSTDYVFNRYRNCAVNGNDAVVTIDQDITDNYTLTGPKRTLTNDFESYYTETRTWSNGSSAVACSANDKYAAIQVPNLAGVSLSVTTTEDRSRNVSLTNDTTNKQSTEASKYSLTGTRQITWQSVTPASGDYDILKQASHAVSQTIQVTTKSGNTTSLSAANNTNASAPLVIQVVRDQTSLAIVSRTIQSGEIDSTFKDGSKVSSVFSNVEYQASSDSLCVPVSGSITGTITPTTGTALTYTITFGDTPTIAFSNGQSVDYVQDGCAFEEDPSKAVDAAAASDVQAPSGITPAAPADGTMTATGTSTSPSSGTATGTASGTASGTGSGTASGTGTATGS